MVSAKDQDDLDTLRCRVRRPAKTSERQALDPSGVPVCGCDFGSTTAKAVVLSAERELLFSCYAPSNGNPIEDAKALFRQLRQAGFEKVAALA